MRQRTAGLFQPHDATLCLQDAARFVLLPTVYPYKCVFETAPSVKFHADGIMYLFTLFFYSGMKPAKRITFEIQEYGISQCLPLLEMSGQFFNGEFFCLRMSDRYSLYVPAGSFLAFANRLPLPLSHDAHRNTAIETAIILTKIVGCFKFDLMFSYHIISYYLAQSYILFLILRIRKPYFVHF